MKRNSTTFSLFRRHKIRAVRVRTRRSQPSCARSSTSARLRATRCADCVSLGTSRSRSDARARHPHRSAGGTGKRRSRNAGESASETGRSPPAHLAPRRAPRPGAGEANVLLERGLEQHAPTGTLTVPAGTAGAEAAGGNLRLPCWDPARRAGGSCEPVRSEPTLPTRRQRTQTTGEPVRWVEMAGISSGGGRSPPPCP